MILIALISLSLPAVAQEAEFRFTGFQEIAKAAQERPDVSAKLESLECVSVWEGEPTTRLTSRVDAKGMTLVFKKTEYKVAAAYKGADALDVRAAGPKRLKLVVSLEPDQYGFPPGFSDSTLTLNGKPEDYLKFGCRAAWKD